MTLSEKIQQILDNQEMPVSKEWVGEVAAEYPAFALPAALLLKRGADTLDSESLKEIRLRLLINSPDPTALADMVDLAGEDWMHLYPREEVQETPSTESAIDTFLETYGNQSAAETEMLEQLIFNPVPADYFPQEEIAEAGDGPLLPPELVPGREKEAAEQDEKDKDVTTVTEAAADAEVSGQEQPDARHSRRREDAKSPGRTEDGLLSESLAKIFIKQRRYERAYEIISNLSLNFPEKSVYFADQLRFLQKLIKNQQYQQQNK